MKIFTTIVMIVMICVMASPVMAFEFLTNRATGMGQASLLSSPSPSELVNLPSGRIALGEYRVETALNRAFDLKDFDQFMLAGAWRKGRLGFAAGFSQFGNSELYSEQIAKLTVFTHYDSLTFAAGGSFMKVAFGGGYEGLSAGTLHLGVAYQRNWLTASAGADNLTSPSLNDGSPKYQPIYTVQAEYRGRQPLSIVGRLQVEQNETARFSLAQHLALGQAAAVMFGLVTAPVQFGGGIEISHKGAILTYSMAVHPVLGLSQTISVSYGNQARKNRGTGEFK
ncbi:MAG: hypothetical protein NDJ18_03345 [candidate division Zixibacteria bacterium]|nr:hypothetical protein [candidate division Zixibacteria bacterium]